MPFTVDRSLRDRPLGFVAAWPEPPGGHWRGWIGVERQAGGLDGAAAAALLPDVAVQGAANRLTRVHLARAAAAWRGIAFIANEADERECGAAVAAIAKAAGCGVEQLLLVPVASTATPGAAASPASQPSDGTRAPVAAAARLGELPVALRRGGADTVPLAAATTRGIVEGHLVSLFALASGRLSSQGRSALRFTLLTDAWLGNGTLDRLLHEGVAPSVATIAGLAAPLPDDGLLALANGVAAPAPLEPDSIGFSTLRVATAALGQSLLRDLLARSCAPQAACLVQISVVGAHDASSAASEAEALAASPELAHRLATGPGVRRSRDGRQAALLIDRRIGRGEATRWTAIPTASAPPPFG
jgi:hypothetical protein